MRMSEHYLWRIACLCLLVAVGGTPVRAQTISYTASRHLTRSNLWVSFNNWGTPGEYYNVTASQAMMKLTYPGALHAMCLKKSSFPSGIRGTTMINYRDEGALDDIYRYTEIPNFRPNPPGLLGAEDFHGKYLSYQYDQDSHLTGDEDTGDPK